MARNKLPIQFSQQSFGIIKIYSRSTGFAVDSHNQFALLLQWKLP